MHYAPSCSAYQVAIQRLVSGESVRFELPSQSSFLDFIDNLLFVILMDGKRVSLAINHPSILAQVYEIIDSVALRSYVKVDHQLCVGEEMIAKWRSLMKQDSKVEESHNGEYERLIGIIREYVHAQNKKIFGNKSYRAISDLRDGRHDVTKDLFIDGLFHDFQFNQTEYWRLKAVIKASAVKWNPIYMIVGRNNIFSTNNTLSAEDNRTKLNHYKTLLISIKTSLWEYKQDYIKKAEAIYDKAFFELRKIEDQISNLIKEEKHKGHKDNPLAKLLFAKPDQVTALRTEIVNKVKNNVLYVGDIPNDLSSLSIEIAQCLADWKKIKYEQIQNGLKRINKLNADSETIKVCDLRLTEVYQTLNADRLLNFEFENTAQHLHAQEQYVNDVLTIIDQALSIVDALPGYLDWFKYADSLTKADYELVKALIASGDEEWMDKFENWYLNGLLNHHRYPLHPELDLAFDRLLLVYKNDRKKKFQSWLHHQDERISDALQRVKKANKPLFKKIMNQEISLEDIKKSDQSLYQILFPILINPSIRDDQAIHLDIAFDELNGGIVLGNSKASELEVLPDALPHITTSLANTPVAKRLELSKGLAKWLINYSPKIRIFILKDRNVISTLSDISNRKYLRFMREAYVKEVLTNVDPEDRISEVIISENPLEVWTDEHLINYEAAGDIPHQRLLMMLLEQAGVGLVSKAQLEHDVMDKLVEESPSLPNEKDLPPTKVVQTIN